MDSKVLQQLLEEVKTGRLPVAEAVERLRTLPFEDLGFARVDHHRQLRREFPEVMFAAGKSLEQITCILSRSRRGQPRPGRPAARRGLRGASTGDSRTPAITRSRPALTLSRQKSPTAKGF